MLQNIAVFNDTADLCKSNSRLLESIKNSIKQQKLILEEDAIPGINKMLYTEPAKLIVSKKRSFEAAAGYRGQNV